MASRSTVTSGRRDRSSRWTSGALASPANDSVGPGCGRRRAGRKAPRIHRLDRARIVCLFAFVAIACDGQHESARASGDTRVVAERPDVSNRSPAGETAVLAATDAPGSSNAASNTLAARIPPPSGFRRPPAPAGSFAAWLRRLPLRPGRGEVRLFDGRPKPNQSAHHAVIEIDVGSRDLQQCADAVIRLRAEYLWDAGCADEIAFDFTSGDRASWVDWRRGRRPVVRGNDVSWADSAAPDDGRANFRRYLETVFTYAGTASVARELARVEDVRHPEVGDVWVQPGFPGHAVLVVDVAMDPAGERVFLLAQSYMPAQDVHVLRSPEPSDPWYRARLTGPLETPEWTFERNLLRRFSPPDCTPSD